MAGFIADSSQAVATPNIAVDILARNSRRRYLLIVNYSSAPAYIRVDADAEGAGIGSLRLEPDGVGYYERFDGACPTERISCVTTVANAQLLVWEGYNAARNSA